MSGSRLVVPRPCTPSAWYVALSRVSLSAWERHCLVAAGDVVQAWLPDVRTVCWQWGLSRGGAGYGQSQVDVPAMVLAFRISGSGTHREQLHQHTPITRSSRFPLYWMSSRTFGSALPATPIFVQAGVQSHSSLLHSGFQRSLRIASRVLSPLVSAKVS